MEFVYEVAYGLADDVDSVVIVVKYFAKIGIVA